MRKQSARKWTLALTLFALTAPGLHASTTPSTPPPPPPPPPPPAALLPSVTGEDLVPTSPNVVNVVLALIRLA
jgi:hypothetical protein